MEDIKHANTIHASHENTPPLASNDLNNRIYFKRMTHYIELELIQLTEILNTRA